MSYICEFMDIADLVKF